MTIGTADAIYKFGTQDEVTTGTPGTVANNAFSVAGDVDSTWSNDDDAPDGAAVLKCQFDTTMPTSGNIGLYARLLDIQSTNDAPIPDANYEEKYVGNFPIDFGVAADTDFYTHIHDFRMPMIGASQIIEWYIKNNGTSQTIGTDWKLWITPKTYGPSA